MRRLICSSWAPHCVGGGTGQLPFKTPFKMHSKRSPGSNPITLHPVEHPCIQWPVHIQPFQCCFLWLVNPPLIKGLLPPSQGDARVYNTKWMQPSFSTSPTFLAIEKKNH